MAHGGIACIVLVEARPDTTPWWHFRGGAGMESTWRCVEAEPKFGALAALLSVWSKGARAARVWRHHNAPPMWRRSDEDVEVGCKVAEVHPWMCCCHRGNEECCCDLNRHCPDTRGWTFSPKMEACNGVSAMVWH
uniref:Uncharacterized protein n=1 Tax=Oryza meridionalis TaxID=40149 RepID=A0A0E0C7M9_9ORYZ